MAARLKEKQTEADGSSAAALIAGLEKKSEKQTRQRRKPALVPTAILPDAIYDEDQATLATGVSYETRYRHVREGKLRVRRCGSRRFYFGADLTRWLRGESPDSAEGGESNGQN
ncbi:MAG: hypothetical protein HOP19_29740 [Acidobacteria bacterium]|nr:hypothetical protein [Acidobacteriota bacterium]